MKRVLFFICIAFLMLSCTKDFNNPLDPTNGEPPAIYYRVFTEIVTPDSLLETTEIFEKEYISGEIERNYSIEFGVSDERETDVTLELYDDNDLIAMHNSEDCLVDTIQFIPGRGIHCLKIVAYDNNQNTVKDSMVFKTDDVAVKGIDFLATEDVIDGENTYNIFLKFNNICGINADSLNMGDSRILFGLTDNPAVVDSVVLADDQWVFDQETNTFSRSGYQFPIARTVEMNLDYIVYDRAGNRGDGNEVYEVYLEDSLTVIVENEEVFGPNLPVSILVNIDKLQNGIEWYGSANGDTVLVEYDEIFPGKFVMTNTEDYSEAETWNFVLDFSVGDQEDFVLDFDGQVPQIISIDPVSFDLSSIVIRECIKELNITFNEPVIFAELTCLDSNDVIPLNINGMQANVSLTLDEELNNYELDFGDLANNSGNISYQLCYYPSLCLDSLIVNEDIFDPLEGILTNEDSLNFRLVFSEEINTESIDITFSSGSISDSLTVEGNVIEFVYLLAGEDPEFSISVEAMHEYGSEYINTNLGITYDVDAPVLLEVDSNELLQIEELPVHFTLTFDEVVNSIIIDSTKISGNNILSIPEISSIGENVVELELNMDNFSSNDCVFGDGNIELYGKVEDELGNCFEGYINENVQIEFSIDRQPPQFIGVSDEDLQDIEELPQHFSITFDELSNFILMRAEVDDEEFDLVVTDIGDTTVTFEINMDNFSPDIIPADEGNISIYATMSDNLGNVVSNTLVTDEVHFSIDRTPPEQEGFDFEELDGIFEFPVSFSIEYDQLSSCVIDSVIVNDTISIELNDPGFDDNTLEFELTYETFTAELVPDSTGMFSIFGVVVDGLGNPSIDGIIYENIPFSIDREIPAIDSTNFDEFEAILDSTETVTAYFTFSETISENTSISSILIGGITPIQPEDVTISDNMLEINILVSDLDDDDNSLTINMLVRDLVGNEVQVSELVDYSFAGSRR